MSLKPFLCVSADLKGRSWGKENRCSDLVDLTSVSRYGFVFWAFSTHFYVEQLTMPAAAAQAKIPRLRSLDYSPTFLNGVKVHTPTVLYVLYVRKRNFKPHLNINTSLTSGCPMGHIHIWWSFFLVFLRWSILSVSQLYPFTATKAGFLSLSGGQGMGGLILGPKRFQDFMLTFSNCFIWPKVQKPNIFHLEW